MVTAQRSTQGLDFDELEEMLNRVSGLADKLDDELSKKYGAMPYYEDRNC
jgi:hypothetical protein